MADLIDRITNEVWSEVADSRDSEWTLRREHIENAVRKALAAAVPADLAEAGKVLEGVTPSKAPNVWRVQKRYSFICHKDTWQVLWDVPKSTSVCLVADTGGDTYSDERDARFIAWCREGVPALIARIAAQEAQIKGLEAERDEPHWDDHCVNQFAKMMREKMAAARAKGRSGWNDPNQCSVDYLRYLLYEHLDKGDPVDVANFCMMLRHYDASTRRDYGNTLDMWKARAEAAETALAAERAKVARLVEAGPPFFFDRYINGVRMAEDVCVERETTLEGAMRVAARIAAKGPNGEPPVLVYRSTETAALAAYRGEKP